MSDLVTLRLDQIDVAGLQRRPRSVRVAAVAASIQAGDTRPVLEVSPPAKDGAPHRLTADLTTYRALESLGAAEVSCRVRRSTAAERQRRELDHDLLASATLTRMERMVALAARKPLYEAEHPETANGGDRRSADQIAKLAIWSGERVEAFAAWAASAYGVSRRTIEADVTVGQSLAPAACALLAEHPLADKPGELSILARQEPGLQRQVALLLTREANPASSVNDALRILNEVVEPAQGDLFGRFYTRTLDTWARLGAREQRRFAEEFLPKLPPEWLEAALAKAREARG